MWNIVEELGEEVLFNLFCLTLDLGEHGLLVDGIELLGEMTSEGGHNGLSQYSLSELMDNVYLIGTVLSLGADGSYLVNKFYLLGCLFFNSFLALRSLRSA